MDVRSVHVDLSEDAPLFLHLASEPVRRLYELYPHLNASKLAKSKRSNLFKFQDNRVQKARSCYSENVSFDDTNSHHKPLSPALIGGIAGGVSLAVLSIVAMLVWILIRRRRLQLVYFEKETERQQQIQAKRRSAMVRRLSEAAEMRFSGSGSGSEGNVNGSGRDGSPTQRLLLVDSQSQRTIIAEPIPLVYPRPRRREQGSGPGFESDSSLRTSDSNRQEHEQDERDSHRSRPEDYLHAPIPSYPHQTQSHHSRMPSFNRVTWAAAELEARQNQNQNQNQNQLSDGTNTEASQSSRSLVLSTGAGLTIGSPGGATGFRRGIDMDGSLTSLHN